MQKSLTYFKRICQGSFYGSYLSADRPIFLKLFQGWALNSRRLNVVLFQNQKVTL